MPGVGRMRGLVRPHTPGLRSIRVAQMSIREQGPQLNVVVRHMTPLSDNSGEDRYLVGLEFIHLSETAQSEVEQLVREYLSIEHRNDPEHGCPSAALLDEIGRCGDATKHAYTDGVLGLVDEIASRLAPSDPPSARGQTLSLFALLIGTLQLSRALTDRRLADELLERGIDNALALLPDE